MAESEANPIPNPREDAFNQLESLLRSSISDDVEQLLADPVHKDEFIEIYVKKALENAKTINNLTRDSIADEALGNQGFNERLERSIAKVQRAGGTIALIRSDLDNFKGVNTQLGHDGADEVLFDAITAMNEAASRKADTVATIQDNYIIAHNLSQFPEQAMTAREHGDELAAILPVTGQEGAIKVAQTAQANFATNLARRFPNDETRPRTGMSMGISILDFRPATGRVIPTGTPAELREQIKTEADDALYVVKLGTKGGVFVHDPNDPRIQARQVTRKA